MGLLKKRNIIAVFGTLLLIGIVIGGFFGYKFLTTPKEIHYHAGFVVFQNDKKIDFSDFKYMRVKPCDDVKGNHSDEDIQAEKAHLHDQVGDLVHVEREQAYWRDLFTNIHYPIDYSKAKAYVNGKEVKDFQNTRITPYESMVILLGSNSTTHEKDAVSKQYIEKKEKESIECGD